MTAFDSSILVKKRSLEEPKRRTQKEDKISGLKFAIAMITRKVGSLKKGKPAPGVEAMIKSYESRLKRLKYDLAELEG